MYPFERFTEPAKKVLTLAQAEAEASGHGYIGTEHLLLGLLREGEGVGAQVLRNVGVKIEAARDTIEHVLGRSEQVAAVQKIVPTSRVRKVVEISFEEARGMGHGWVGTEHLLLGLLVEGEGIAAHVLEDRGATLSRVRPEIERLIGSGKGEQGTAAAPLRLLDVERLAQPEALAALAVLMRRFGLEPAPPPELLELIRRARIDATLNAGLGAALESWRRSLRGEA